MVTACPTTDGTAGQPSVRSDAALRFILGVKGGTFGFGTDFGFDGRKPDAWRPRHVRPRASSSRVPALAPQPAGRGLSRRSHRRPANGDGRPSPA